MKDVLSRRTVVINSASGVLAKAVNAAILLWLHQYLLKRITPEEYSLYPVILGLMVFPPVLATLLTSGLGRYVLEAYVQGDERGVRRVVSTMFPFLLGTGLALLAGGWCAAWRIDAWLRLAPERVWDARLMLGMMIVPVALSFPVSPFSCGLWVRQKFVWINIIELGGEILRAVLLLVLLLGVDTRVIWVAAATMVSQVAKLLTMQYASRRALPALKLRWRDYDWNMARALTGFGLWSLIGQCAERIRAGAHPLILKNLATATDVATFNIGWIFFNQISLLEYIVTRPVQPGLTALHALGDRARLRRAYLCGGRYGLWGTMLLVIPLLVYRREFVSLYAGVNYVQAGTILAVLLLTFPLEYGNNMMARLAYASGELRPWAWRMLAVQILTVIAALLLVGQLHLGAFGAALATLAVTALAQPLLFWPLGLRMAGARWREWFRATLLPGLLPGAVGAAAWYAPKLLIEVNSWLILLACTAVGAVVYVLAVARLGLRSGERREIVAALMRLRQRVQAARLDAVADTPLAPS
jgi:O-antigen/teichoic acid export membrane protein